MTLCCFLKTISKQVTYRKARAFIYIFEKLLLACVSLQSSNQNIPLKYPLSLTQSRLDNSSLGRFEDPALVKFMERLTNAHTAGLTIDAKCMTFTLWI